MPDNIIQLRIGVDGLNEGKAAFSELTNSTKEFDQAVQVVNTSNERQAALFNETAAAVTQEGYSIREARGAARLLSDELGVHLNRELAGVLARSPLIGAALESAFSVIAVVGFIDILEQVGKAIDSDIEKLAGWSKQAQEAYSKELQRNSAELRTSIEQKDAERRLNEVGLEGVKLRTTQIDNLIAKMKDYARESGNAGRQEQEFNEKMAKLQGGVHEIPFIWDTDKLEKEKSIIQSSLDSIINNETDFTDKQRALATEVKKGLLEVLAEGAKDARTDADAKIKAQLGFEQTLFSSQEAAAKRNYELQESSLDQEVVLLKDVLTRKLAAEESAYERERAIKVAEGELGKNVQPEIKRMDEEMISDRIRINDKLLDLDADLQRAEMKQVEETNTLRIDAAHRLQEDMLRIQVDTGRDEDEAQRKRIENKKTEIEAEVALARTLGDREMSERDRIDNERLAHHEIILKQWQQQEVAALDKWYNAQVLAIEKAEHALILAGQYESAEMAQLKNREVELEQQYANKIAQIDQQIAQKQQEEIKKITTEINSGLNQWLSGHEKFGKAMIKVWDQMVISIIDDIAKMGEQFVLTLVTQGLAAEKSVLIAAKQAAATAWSTAPNPIIGAVEAAATFATIVGTYTPSFAQGGIVNANLHEGEMVLPPHISSFVQDAAASAGVGPGGSGGGSGGTSITHHHRWNINVGEGMSEGAVKSMIQSEVVPQVQKALSRGKF